MIESVGEQLINDNACLTDSDIQSVLFDSFAVQIGSNDFVNKVVKETGRYSIDIEEVHDDVIFILKIAGRA